jgi:hypothetical protein
MAEGAGTRCALTLARATWPRRSACSARLLCSRTPCCPVALTSLPAVAVADADLGLRLHHGPHRSRQKFRRQTLHVRPHRLPVQYRYRLNIGTGKGLLRLHRRTPSADSIAQEVILRDRGPASPQVIHTFSTTRPVRDADPNAAPHSRPALAPDSG